MRRWLPLTLLIACWLAAFGARAEVIADLYEVRVPVASQGQRELGTAAREGLAELLVRLSGNSDAPSEPGLRTALGNAQRYLEQYRYDRQVPTGDEPPATEWAAVLKFAREPVDQLLRAAGLPVWSANRPVLMVWLARDEGGTPNIVNEASHPELVAELRAHARRRGVILRFPLLDLDDLATISAEDVWRLDGLALQEATARYPVDAVLGGRATEVSDGRWLGSWRLAVDEERHAFDVEGDSRDAWLGKAVDQVATALAAHYVAPAGSGAAATQLLLELSGVRDFRAYAEALQFLQRLDQVRDLQVLEVRGDRLLLSLQASAGQQPLQRLLGLDSRLQPEDGAAAGAAIGEPGADGRLRYRWRSAGG